MRIAMIGQKGIPAKYGGVETHVHELCAGLAMRGCDVTAYARAWYTQTTPAVVDGVRVQYAPSVHTKHLDTITHTFFATIDAIKQKFDIIHYHGVGPSLCAWIPRLFSPNTIIISTFHTLDRKNRKWGVLAKLFLLLGEWAACTLAHKTIVVSATLQQYVRDVYDTAAVYIPNSVPLYQKSTSVQALEQWGLLSGEYFLFVARLIPLKGAHTLISAYAQLKQERPDVLGSKKLVIVGDAVYTNSYVASLKTQAAGDPDIIFTGFQNGDTLAQLYSHAYALVHPSEYEGLSLTVLEGMSYGLPLIVSDIPEHRLLIPNSDRRFSPSDALSLKVRMTQLLGTKMEKITQEAKQHQEKIREQFTIEQSIGKVKTVYEDLYKQKEYQQQQVIDIKT